MTVIFSHRITYLDESITFTKCRSTDCKTAAFSNFFPLKQFARGIGFLQRLLPLLVVIHFLLCWNQFNCSTDDGCFVGVLYKYLTKDLFSPYCMLPTRIFHTFLSTCIPCCIEYTCYWLLRLYCTYCKLSLSSNHVVFPPLQCLMTP